MAKDSKLQELLLLGQGDQTNETVVNDEPEQINHEQIPEQPIKEEPQPEKKKGFQFKNPFSKKK